MKLIAVDVETTGLNTRKDRLHGIGIAFEEDNTVYGQTPPPTDCAWIGHNLRFDLKFLLGSGHKTPAQFWDTKLLAQIINENQELGLKPLSLKYLGPWALDNKKELDRAIAKAKAKDLGHFNLLDLDDPEHPYAEIIGTYCEEDCNNTFKLFYVLGEKLKQLDKSLRAKFPQLKKTPKDYYVEEAMPIEKVLLAMELRGIRVDMPRVEAYKAELMASNAKSLEQLSFLCQNYTQIIEDGLYEAALDKRKSPKGKAGVKRHSAKYKTIFNWQSAAQVGRLFYQEMGLGEYYSNMTTSGQWSTKEDAIRELAAACPAKYAELFKVFGEYKKDLKLLTTYTGVSKKKGLMSFVEKREMSEMLWLSRETGIVAPAPDWMKPGGQIPVNEVSDVRMTTKNWMEYRVYPEYMQAGAGKESSKGGTVTGRLSAKNPPIQTLPRKSGVKRFFIPDTEDHCFLYLDYSQLELRLAAHLSKDPKLILAYESGLDLHQQTADALGISRQGGKTFNFAMIYDASAYRLAQELQHQGSGDYTVEQVQVFRRQWFEEYSVYKDFLRRIRGFMEKHKWIISECGRMRRLPNLAYGEKLNYHKKTYQGSTFDLLLKGEVRLSPTDAYWRAKRKYQHALKQGYNFPIQSLGASITKRGMIALHNESFDLVTQVHDSVIIQVLKCEAEDKMLIAQKILETVYPLRVPLKAEPKLLNSFEETDIYECSRNDSSKCQETA